MISRIFTYKFELNKRFPITRLTKITINVLFISFIPLIGASAQERINCDDYYLSVATDHHRRGDITAALTNYYKQKRYYPNCPESEIALYKTIEIYHNKIMIDGRVGYVPKTRALVIEFSEASDDSTMIADVKIWWTEIQQKEKEITLTAPIFWQIVGSAALFVIYFTVAGG